MTPLHERPGVLTFAIWCGLGYILLLGIGWGAIAGFFPITPPGAGQAEAVAVFADDPTRIRVGMVTVMLGALVLIPFGAVIAYVVKRVEGGAGVLTFSVLLGTAGLMVLTFYPAMTWLVAAYRPERDPSLTYLLSDAGWLQFVGGLTMLLAMPLALAAAAFLDERDDAVFPRWFGYLNVWVVLLLLPDQLLFFFHDGPFSWNGLMGFYVPAIAFIAWFATTIHLLRRAVPRLAV